MSGKVKPPAGRPTIEDASAITSSPDLKRGLGLWRMLKQVRVERSLLPLRDYILVPAPPPSGNAAISLRELADSLKTDDEDVAKALLAEAEAIYQEPVDRIDSAERRATTLQGTVAIAASVAVAGGGLLLDPAKITGEGWRIAIGLLLFAFVLCLAGCAMRALGATSRIFRFEEPGPDRITDRVNMDKCEVLTYRAAELLRAHAVADIIGRVKVGLLRSAAWWFRLAILALAALSGLIAAYAIAGQKATKTSATPTTTTRAAPTTSAAPTAPPTAGTTPSSADQLPPAIPVPTPLITTRPRRPTS